MKNKRKKNTKPSRWNKWWTGWKKDRPTSQAMVVVTASAVILTLALVIVGYLQIKIQREASHKQTRAYLDVVSLPDSLDFPINRTNKLKFAIKNLGLTPAREVRYFALWVIKDSITDDPKDVDINNVKSFSIGSGVEAFCTAGFHDAKEEISKRSRLFLYGKITYKDVFDEPQYVVFCFEYLHLFRRFNVYKRFNYQS